MLARTLAMISLVIFAAAVPVPAEGGDQPPAPASRHAFDRWFGQDGEPLPFADDDALLEFLENAKVVKRSPIKRGVTRPDKLVLELDGVRARAVFHVVDVVKDRQVLGSGEILYHFRDSFRNNVAAYELGRLLGIENVPPAVIRRLKGKEGSVQLWIENAYTETERMKRPPEALPIAVRRSAKDMWVFDNLVNNIDRNAGNMLYDDHGRFWWIDHTRALSRGEDLPKPDRVKGCSRSLFAAIRDLDQQQAEVRLAPYLSEFEIDGLFTRRDKLVALIDRMIAENGEENVLFAYD